MEKYIIREEIKTLNPYLVLRDKVISESASGKISFSCDIEKASRFDKEELNKVLNLLKKYYPHTRFVVLKRNYHS